MDKVSLSMLMEMFMKEIGLKTKLMVREHTSMLMEQCIKANGNTIYKMDKEWKHGQMAQLLKERIKMDLRMVLDIINGLMVQSIMVIG